MVEAENFSDHPRISVQLLFQGDTNTVYVNSPHFLQELNDYYLIRNW
jgi:hypothetical protein